LTEIKEEIRDVQMLRRTAADVLRMHRECEDIARDVAKLETELSATGSTATTEEIQGQLANLSEQM
jgi:DNA repair protein RAD50